MSAYVGKHRMTEKAHDCTMFLRTVWSQDDTAIGAKCQDCKRFYTRSQLEGRTW